MGSLHGCGFEVDGAEIVEGGMASARVVERFDSVEYRLGEPDPGWLGVPTSEIDRRFSISTAAESSASTTVPTEPSKPAQRSRWPNTHERKFYP